VRTSEEIVCCQVQTPTPSTQDTLHLPSAYSCYISKCHKYYDDHTFHVDTVVLFVNVINTMMMSRGERKLDRLKRESWLHPRRRKPVRCQCTPHRRDLFGKGWGRERRV